MLKPLAVGFLALIAFDIQSALACDPNEECSKCLASAFGHCITTGNDPVCEARKLACQRAPAVVNTPGSPFGPGGPLAQGGPAGLSVPQIQQCIENMSSCPGQIMGRMTYQMVRPIVDGYIGYLNSQVGNNVSSFDADFIAAIQRYYSIDIRNVRYATGINTLHGMNITIGNMIYFVDDMDFSDPDDAQTAYHELEHVVQYANRGGVEPFLAEYILKAGGSILQGGNSINIHNNIDLEQAAIRKASLVSAAVAANGGAQVAQPVEGPPLPPPVSPGPMSVGNICRTPITACPLFTFLPVNLNCWCPTPGGPSVGGVAQQ